MKFLMGVITLVLCSSAIAARPSGPRVTRSQCGNGLGAMKVWADKQRFRVNAQGKSVDLNFVYRLRPPATQPRTRKTKWQKNIWEIKGQIVEYKLDHGEIRIVLYWDTRYMNVVLPYPQCLMKKTRMKSSMINTWNFFVSRCGTPRFVFQPLGAVVYVRGVGFWANKNLHRRGIAPNGAELHPITRIDVVAGCGT